MSNDATTSADDLRTTGVRRARADLNARVRDAALAAAREILATEGVAALTVRRLAQALDCSTKVVYTQFGGKDGLLHALYLAAFARLGAAMATVPRDPDPLVRLRGGCAAYRRMALEDPTAYGIMFGGLIGAYRPPEASRRAAWETFGSMRRTVAECMEAGRLRADDPSRVAKVLWVTMHGVVSLEIQGLLDEPDGGAALYANTLAATFASLGAAAT